MSAPDLPEFERTIRLSQGNLDAAELAECHGLMCGLLCRAGSSTATDFKTQLAAMQLVVDPLPGLDAVLTEAHETTARQLEDDEFGFVLWLPDDEEPLEERIVALGQWCSGFLVGLACGGKLDTLTEEATEAIDDLQQIARAEMSAPGPADDENEEAENEEDENAFVEIVEYVRVVVLMMQEEFRGPGQSEAIH
jgi:uncharacterized protein YgfB (UPF0149 family)